ncbi:MAG TPA: YqaJ viral recombinase family protein [Gemmatimonadaceae bacterium]|nr:YqaJ viral recombinase family protein [Gemmatimonadaceae bacterium]
MIRLDYEQGSVEWRMARVGKLTASHADEIITATGKQSSQWVKLMYRVVAEQLLNVPLDDGAGSEFMERGNILEKKAVSYYELQKDGATEPGGFVLRDDERTGASPDRLVGTDGLLEIKCPAAHTHIGYLLDADGIGYKAQVQAQLWVCEREWSDTLSFNPEMPPALVRQYRDEKFIASLADYVKQFHDAVDEAKEKLQKGYNLFPGFERPMMRVVA